MWYMLVAKLPVLAAAFGAACNPNTANAGHKFFGFPSWWEYISTGQKDILGKCVPKVNFPDGAWAIGLAILDMLLYLAGLVAVISIIVAGFEYMFTQGNSEKGVSARKRVVNSLIGLAMVLVAGGIVSFAGNKLG